MAQTYDTFWQQRYAKRLMDLIEQQKDTICAGAAENYADYKMVTGVIRGLTNALEAIDELNSEIRKAEQGSK